MKRITTIFGNSIILAVATLGLLLAMPVAAVETTVTFSSTSTNAWSDGIANDGDGGSTDISGKVIQFYPISDTNGTHLNLPLIYPDFSRADGFVALTTYDPSVNDNGFKGMAIRSQDGSAFQLNGFFYSNWGEGSATTITVKGYNDGAEVASTSFATASAGGWQSATVTLGSTFDQVDEVRLYSSGTSWHGLNSIKIDDAVVASSTHTVTSSAASGAGSFLEAFTSANVVGQSHIIVFDATAFDPATKTEAQRTITLNASLPSYVGSGLTLNGDVNADGIPDVILDGAEAYSGLNSTNAAALVIQSMTFRNFRSSAAAIPTAIRLAGAGSSLVIRDSVFHGNRNTSTALGGGALIVLHLTNTLEIDRSVFYSNFHGLNGGVLYCVPTNAVIANSVFYDNEAGGSGTNQGGGAIRYQANTAGAALNIFNCTIVGNRAPNGSAVGGGIALSATSGATVNLHDSIVAGNTGPGGASSDIGVTGSGSYTANNVTTGSASGLFVNLGSGAARDLRLASSSPAINAGGSTTTSPAQTFDVLRNPRLLGGNLDRGAYEYLAARTLDLDADNSSAASGTAYSTSGAATQNVTVNVADSDAAIGALASDSNVRSVSFVLSGDVDSGETLLLTGSHPNVNAVAFDAPTKRFVLYSKTNAFLSDMQAAVRSVAYRNGAASPSSGARTVSVTISDASDSASAFATVTLGSGNTPPSIGQFSGDTVTYTEGSGPVVIDQNADATATDGDSADFSGGELRVSIVGNKSGEEVLSIVTNGTVSLSFFYNPDDEVRVGGVSIGKFIASGTGTGGSDLTLALTNGATPARIQSVLRSLALRVPVPVPTTATRSVAVTLTDGNGGSVSVTNSVAVSRVHTGGNEIKADFTDNGTTTGDSLGNSITENGIVVSLRNGSGQSTGTFLYDGPIADSSFDQGAAVNSLNNDFGAGNTAIRYISIRRADNTNFKFVGFTWDQGQDLDRTFTLTAYDAATNVIGTANVSLLANQMDQLFLNGAEFPADDFLNVREVRITSDSTSPPGWGYFFGALQAVGIADPVLPANNAPTDLALSNSTVNQSGGANATVGTLSTTDADGSDTHTYTLVSGAGDTHNGSFNLSGSTLRANDASALAAGSYSVRIQTDDGNGGTYAEAFSITVQRDVFTIGGAGYDVFQFVTDGSPQITKDALEVGTGNPVTVTFGSVPIGTTTEAFVAAQSGLYGEEEPDASGTVYFVPTDTTNYNDNASFIVQSMTHSFELADFSYYVALQTVGVPVTLTVRGYYNGTLVDTASMVIQSNTLGTAAAFLGSKFTGSGNQVNRVIVSADDSGSSAIYFALNQFDLDQFTPLVFNNAPTDLALAGSALGSSTNNSNAVVGTLSTTDADVSDTHSYSLVSGTGSTHNGSFVVQSNQLKVGVSALAAGSYSVRIQTDDGNGGTYAEAFSVTVVDDVSPTVVGVTVPANGTYRAGQNLEFTVGYSETVTVVGTPQVGLTVGSTARNASYVSGSGTTDLLFRYVVASGDEDTNGVAVASAVTANGGTIRDGATNNAVATLNSVGATTGVLVDAVLPTIVSIARKTPVSQAVSTNAVVFAVTFSEAVSNVGTSLFSVVPVNGATVTGTVTGVTGGPVVYEVAVSVSSGTGEFRLNGGLPD